MAIRPLRVSITKRLSPSALPKIGESSPSYELVLGIGLQCQAGNLFRILGLKVDRQSQSRLAGQ